MFYGSIFPPPPPKRLSFNLATLVRIFVLAAFLVTAVQSSAFAGAQDFVLVNNSGKKITELRFSQSWKRNFEDNVLKEPIYHGESKKINVNGYSRSKEDQYWDFKVVTSDDTVWTWYGIDLFSVGRITVDGAGTAHY